MTEKRRSRLADILAQETPANAEVKEEAPATVAAAPAPAREPKAKTAAPAPVTKASGPRFADFERKETRLRQDQLDALEALAKKIKRARQPGAGERITDNTLIRVAVDLLLARQEELNGSTEAELRNSVSL